MDGVAVQRRSRLATSRFEMVRQAAGRHVFALAERAFDLGAAVHAGVQVLQSIPSAGVAFD